MYPTRSKWYKAFYSTAKVLHWDCCRALHSCCCGWMAVAILEDVWPHSCRYLLPFVVISAPGPNMIWASMAWLWNCRELVDSSVMFRFGASGEIGISIIGIGFLLKSKWTSSDEYYECLNENDSERDPMVKWSRKMSKFGVGKLMVWKHLKFKFNDSK